MKGSTILNDWALYVLQNALHKVDLYVWSNYQLSPFYKKKKYKLK